MYSNSIPVNDLFEQLKSIASPPTEEVFNSVVERQSEIIPLLVDELEVFSLDPSVVKVQGSDYIRHVISIFILAYLRHDAAYPHVIKLISRPGDEVVQLTGEVFTEALGRILASVYDGDIKPIKSVVENPALNPWLRSGALDSFMVLWKEGVISRDEVVAYLKELMETRLERVPGYVWDSVAFIAYDLHPGELEVLLRQAIDDHLIAPMVLNHNSLKVGIENNIIDTIKSQLNVVDGYIKEPVKELTWWLYPDKNALDKGLEYASVAVPVVDKNVTPGERSTPMGWRSDTVVRKTTKVGRNEICPCGSNVKFKKCCGIN